MPSACMAAIFVCLTTYMHHRPLPPFDIDEPFRNGFVLYCFVKNRIKIREIVDGLQENPMRFDMKWLA